MHDPFYPVPVSSPEDAGLHGQIAEDFSRFYETLLNLIADKGNPREMALVKTKLQEACMWANRAIAEARP